MTITSFGQALPFLFGLVFFSRMLYLRLQIVKAESPSTTFYAYGIVTRNNGITEKVQEWTGQRRE